MINLSLNLFNVVIVISNFNHRTNFNVCLHIVFLLLSNNLCEAH